MKFSTSLSGFAGKVSTLTLALMLSCVTFTNQSCSAKLPSEVTTIVGNLSTQLPKFMSQATDMFGPKYADQAKGLLDMINQGANLTKGGKFSGMSDLFTKLGTDNVAPFVENWKTKGKLNSSDITAATKATNDALGAIKKAGKMK